MALPTIESINTGIQDLLKRIQTEGVTGTKGEVLLAPQQLQTTPTGQINPIITADSLNQPITPLTLPTPTPSTLGTQANALVAGAAETQKSIADYLKLLTPTETPESKRIKELTAQVEGLLPKAEGRGVAQLEAETLQDIPGKRTALTAVQGQIASKIAEFNKIEADYMKAVEATERVPGTTTGIVAGQQRQLARDLAIQRTANAAEVGMLQAQSQILQGNLSVAQATADRAVDLKYADIHDEINTRLKQLEILRPELNKQEKLRADAIQLYLNDQKTAIATAQANEKDKNATLLNQMQRYPDALIQLTDTLEQANQKVVKNSAIYKKEAQITSGESVVDIRQQRNDLADLLAQIATYQTREQATSELDNYKSSIITRIGQEGFNKIQQEVDRKFPPPKEEIITEAKPSIFETVTGAVGGFFNRLFQK